MGEKEGIVIGWPQGQGQGEPLFFRGIWRAPFAFFVGALFWAPWTLQGAGRAPSEPSKEEEFKKQLQGMIKEREETQRAMEHRKVEADAYRKAMTEKILSLRPVPKASGETPSPGAGQESPSEPVFLDGFLFPVLAAGLAAFFFFVWIRHLKRKREIP